ncbi:MAG: hypothetical protein ACT4NL_02310 [Pseudomarimonas sp.]
MLVAPERVGAWSDGEDAERWVRLFPVRAAGEIHPEGCRRKAEAEAMLATSRKPASRSRLDRCA